MNPKTWVLIAIAAAALLSGIIGQHYYADRLEAPSDLVFFGTMAFLIFVWYRLDADQRGYRRTPLLSLAVVALAGIALPYYFFRSRGAKGGFIAIGLSILVLLGTIVLTVAGNYFAYYVLQG